MVYQETCNINSKFYIGTQVLETGRKQKKKREMKARTGAITNSVTTDRDSKYSTCITLIPSIVIALVK